ncbi:MAG: leucyl aminopeptidase [Firmicutes bacterium]|nr:leucyl aminopeptidase [Bacillota bacterium]
MEIKIYQGEPEPARLVTCFQDLEPVGLPQELHELVTDMQANDEFKGKFGETHTIRLKGTPRHVIVIGLGKQGELTLEQVRKIVGKAVKAALKLKTSGLDIFPAEFGDFAPPHLARAIAEAAELAAYKFDSYKSERQQPTLESVNLVWAESQEVPLALAEGKALATATSLARRLVNEPANKMTPAQLAAEAEAMGESNNIEVEILEEDRIQALGMEAFMSVARASTNRPRLIVMRHRGAPESDRMLALVGKGLTYDSGGLSIKPTEGMAFMKCDMGGAAAVVGAMAAIGEMKLPANVVGIVAACENMIAGNAYKPGDIIGSMGGKTIEVGNTDAEGRLTLADAITYAIREEKASHVLDIATLTGAALIALGDVHTAVLASDDSLFGELEYAAELSGEKIWRLPHDPEYKVLLKSDVADLRNTGTQRLAGTIAAGLFLQEFTEEKPWLHLDIAGTAWTSKEGDYSDKGGTGWGVRTLYHLAKQNG